MMNTSTHNAVAHRLTAGIRQTTLHLTVLCLLAFGLGAPLQAQEALVGEPAAVATGPAAFGASIFVGPSDGEPFQLVQGYASGAVYTHTRGGAITVTDEAITLRRNGIYRVHVEGALAFDMDDPTAGDSASARFNLLLEGGEWVGCVTSANGNTPTLPVDWFLAGRQRVAACTVDFTFEVRGNESSYEFPVSFGRGATVQVGLSPNDQPLGDNTLILARVEVQRLGR